MTQPSDQFSGDFFRSKPHQEDLWRLIKQPAEAAQAEIMSAADGHKQAKINSEFHIAHHKPESVMFLHIPHHVSASRLSRKIRLTASTGDPLAPHSNGLATPLKQVHIKHTESITIANIAKQESSKSSQSLGITTFAKAPQAAKIRAQASAVEQRQVTKKTRSLEQLTITALENVKMTPGIVVGSERIPLVALAKNTQALQATTIILPPKRHNAPQKGALADIFADSEDTFLIPEIDKQAAQQNKMSRHSVVKIQKQNPQNTIMSRQRVPQIQAKNGIHQSRVLPLAVLQTPKQLLASKNFGAETIPQKAMQSKRQAWETRQRECAQRIQLVIDITRKDFSQLGKLRPKAVVEQELAEKRLREAQRIAPHHTLQGRRFLTKQKRAKRKSFFKNTLGEVTKFAITSAAIFGISFSVMNAPALSQLMMARIDPVSTVEKQIALEKVSDTGAPEQEAMPILPTAGMKRETHKVFPTLAIRPAPLENRIVIPKIGKNIPLVDIAPDSLLKSDWAQLEKDIQGALKDGVVHYPGTAQPGQLGNVFITGHSSYYFWDPGKYKDVFARLHDLDVGDEFTIFWEQDVYKYRIRERKVVPPEDTEVLQQPRNEKIATLMTCTPVGTAKDRLILVAEQI